MVSDHWSLDGKIPHQFYWIGHVDVSSCVSASNIRDAQSPVYCATTGINSDDRWLTSLHRYPTASGFVALNTASFIHHIEVCMHMLPEGRHSVQGELYCCTFPEIGAAEHTTEYSYFWLKHLCRLSYIRLTASANFTRTG